MADRLAKGRLELEPLGAKLTPKQSNFVAEVLGGKTLSDAYRAAYRAENMSQTTINREAHAVARNPKVAAMLQAGKRVVTEAVIRRAGDLRLWVLERLQREAADPESSAAARVSALVALGRTTEVDLFGEQPPPEPEKSREELIADIRAILTRNLDRPSIEMDEELDTPLLGPADTPVQDP